jgi:serine protease Do
MILTKASELRGVLSVRLADGRILPATLQNYSRSYDLALLTIGVRLKTLELDFNTSLSPGDIVVVPIPGASPRIGIVSRRARVIPRDRGFAHVSLRDSDHGVEVVDNDLASEYGFRLRSGDIIRRVETYPIPNVRSLIRLLGDTDAAGSLRLNAGDPICMTIERDSTTINMHAAMPALYWPRPATESRRFAGFPQVVDIDVKLSPAECGAPVVDIHKRLVGITIATRGETTSWPQQPTYTHMIPMATLRDYLARQVDFTQPGNHAD